jgi:DNA-binding phage protein
VQTWSRCLLHESERVSRWANVYNGAGVNRNTLGRAVSVLYKKTNPTIEKSCKTVEHFLSLRSYVESGRSLFIATT